MRAIDLHHWIAKAAPPHTPEHDVDGIMAGDPEAEVHGVAVTWLANHSVLERAAARRLNFVIAHEPVFYHHPFYYPYGTEHHVPAEDLEDKIATPPGQAKKQLIDQHGLVAYRLHDGWDQFPEYGIGHALAETLGWSDKQISADYVYALPSTKLKNLAADIAHKLGKTGIRFVGDPERSVTKITLDWGSPGAIDIIMRALASGCDAALTGEVIEWRDIEFARDAGVALITGGHCATETPGMRGCCTWLKQQWPNLQVDYIDTIDPDHFARS